MADPTHKETYDHIASRTIVDGQRVSEIAEGKPHPEIFGENIVEVTEIQTAPPEGFREVAASGSTGAKAASNKLGKSDKSTK